MTNEKQDYRKGHIIAYVLNKMFLYYIIGKKKSKAYTINNEYFK